MGVLRGSFRLCFCYHQTTYSFGTVELTHQHSNQPTGGNVPGDMLPIHNEQTA